MRVQLQALFLGVLMAGPSFAQFSPLVTFNGTNGSGPNPLTLGADGNYYGTTGAGGASSQGTFFQMTPAGSLTTVYSFGPTTQGVQPNTALVQGADGSFYGTTASGGTNTNNPGTIFKITSSGSFTTVYSLGGSPTDPGTPMGGLTLGSDGNFYGTSSLGGSSLDGTIFKMTPQGNLNVIYNFTGAAGQSPGVTLVQASDGNLYGTAASPLSAANYSDYFFNISPTGSLNLVYTFSQSNAPTSNLTLASDGNFYGSSAGGGASGQGSFFKITKGGTLTTIATLPAFGDGGAVSLIQGRDGNFYGTTAAGGAAGYGMVFKITPTGGMSILYSFCEQSGCPDSSQPTSLIQAPDGSLIGTTYPSGGNGTIFRILLPDSGCTATAAPSISTIDSAAAYGGYSYFASGSWLEIKGIHLVNPSDPRLTATTNPGQWTASDFNGANAPTSLDGNSVSINGKPAYVWYISTTQINVQAPEDTDTGAVSITASNCVGAGLPYMFMKQPLAPGLLAPSNYSANGTQYLVATFASDGAYVLDTTLGASFGLKSRPAAPGDLIIAYGVGFGDVTPSILPGVIVGQSNSLVNPVTFSFGPSPATLSYSGLAGSFVGLYEFYITVPSGLASGDYPIVVAQNGAQLPQTFSLTVQN